MAAPRVLAERIRTVTPELRHRFAADGFVSFERLLRPDAVAELNERLEKVLRGEYDTGSAPDKRPKVIKEANSGILGYSGNKLGVRTLQIINVWKCDSAFRDVVTSRDLGRMVAELAGWPSGARLAQDQVWAKPPGAPPLVFHRDSPYFDFTPADVVTVWVALDTMEEELGPLEYVKGSHRWGDDRTGSASVFFDENRFSLVHSAAASEGIKPDELQVVSMRGLPAGGCSVHDGRTWHGSGANTTDRTPRRGLGIHFVPAEVVFKQGELGRLWEPFKMPDTDALPLEHFPITFDGEE